ncbi:uncharacterized protein STEHIDRAFT_116682 [Stereum hirsutum FP-91666 SS1]|uniref:Uncharacterized protein n=1 Tax=Stereum hirsutum (strain FP-91666) TaxID=721885 RepID=R7RWM0_STEHR|nr:uncharacterized protein STEHIDRAFT_116682 [Stereum hirsutum FP-91666 SS1]EIM79205.1 hypothetical protein STEHIDRAFT_116682 [Stereum hirsutum FP-91666 SS1]
MSITMSTLPPFHNLTDDIVDHILKTLFCSIMQDFTRSGTLWKLSPNAWTKTLRVLYDKFFRLRLICKNMNERITYHGILWTILPLGQMDQLDVQRSLKYSKNCPLTVLLSDARSRSNFDILLHSSQHKNRVQTLYIDLMASEWPGLSMIMQLHQFPALETLFLSSRGIEEEEEDEDAVIVANVGGWGNAPANMGGWGNATANNTFNWAVGGGNGVVAALPTHPTAIPTIPPLVARRHGTQLSYKVGIANLAHVSANVLCIRDRAFAWQHFTPPYRLTTLQVQAGYESGDGRFPLNIEHLDRAIRPITTLRELQLWDVDAYGPHGLQPITQSNVRYIAIRGTHGSIAAVSHYLRYCNPRVLIIEITDEFSGSHHAVYTDIQSAAQTFTDLHTISSVGVFVTISETPEHNNTVDLVLTAADGSVLSLQVPYSHSRALHAIMQTCVPKGTRLSFEITPGDEYGEVTSTVFLRCISLDAFTSYHLRVESHQITPILSTLEHHRPREPVGFVWLHGESRCATWARVVTDHQQWIPYVRIAVVSKCSTTKITHEPNWVDWQNKPLFSPSVTKAHTHLMRMMRYME